MYINLVKNKLTIICTVGLQVILAFFYLYCLKLLLTGIHYIFWKKEKVDLVQMCSRVVAKGMDSGAWTPALPLIGQVTLGK